MAPLSSTQQALGTSYKRRDDLGIGDCLGRIILLGDGTEALTDSNNNEMVNRDEEDKDLES